MKEKKQCHKDEKQLDLAAQKKEKFLALVSILSSHLKNGTTKPRFVSVVALWLPTFLMAIIYQSMFGVSVWSNEVVYANSDTLVKFYFYCCLSFMPSLAILSFDKYKTVIISMLIVGFCSNIIIMIDASYAIKSPTLYLMDEWLQDALMTLETGLVIIWIAAKLFCWLSSWLELDT